MAGDGSSEDEIMLREREETLRSDRKKQAEWYESLNLFAEALRVYELIEDKENIERLRSRMRDDYGRNAALLEEKGRYQDAANLYYLIGDHAGVGRMKELKKDLVILYDNERGGLAQLASSLGTIEEETPGDVLFSKPNEGDIEEGPEEGVGSTSSAPAPEQKRKVPVKMPRGKKARFCAYCGEEITTKKEPRFCPFCGEELG